MSNAFNWRENYANRQSVFAADPSHRTRLYAEWCRTDRAIPWPQYRDDPAIRKTKRTAERVEGGAT
jgi:hypothetical protein